MRHSIVLVVGLTACTLQTSDYVQSDRASAGTPAIRGTGISATQIRDVQDFDRVRTEGFVDIAATVGTAHTAELTCDDNVLAHLDTVVQDRTLVVSVRASAGNLRPKARCLLKLAAPVWVGIEAAGSASIALEGPAPGLRDITLRGSGNIVASGIDTDVVHVNSAGSGVIKLFGRARRLEALAQGAGDLRLGHLMVSEAAVETRGAGDIRVAAESTVKAVSLGSGDIVVQGKATIDATTKGSGRISSEP